MSLRYFRRPVKALIVTGIAASTIGMAALPAAAASPRSSEWWMSTLGIRNAWPVSRGAGITVAVLSDGVDTRHPDLTGPRFITGPDYTGTGQGSGQYFGEIGTGVAGIIAAHGYGLQSQNGVIGEVPLANILSVRVVLPPGDPLLTRSTVAAHLPDAIAQGIRYAVSHGASVIDLPTDPGQAGITGSGGASAAAGGSPAEAAAVKYALSRNVVLVAPAGDNYLGSDAPNYPAAYPGVIAVGAFDKAFVKAPWTSHQSYVTLTAAGSGMTVATNTGRFETADSTTYASAVVTGIVAMLQGRFPGITAAQVRHALTRGTVFHGARGHANGSGYGTVNADKALTVAEGALAPATSLAGTRATAASAPAAPVASSSHQGLMHSISRAGIYAAGLLVILLALIALYAVSGRRRAARRRSATAADWSRQGVARHPRAGATDAERMAAYFAAPVARPAAGAARPASRGLRPSTADRVFSGSSRPAPLGGQAFDAGSAASGHPPWDAPETGSSSPIGPASKAVARRPPVSGAPPWEEAAAPQGELPWASPADRDPGAGRHSGGHSDLGAAASTMPAAPPLPTRSPARHQATGGLADGGPAESGLWDRAAQPRAGETAQPAGAHAEFRRTAFRQAAGQQPDPFGSDAYAPIPVEPAEPTVGTGLGQPADTSSRPGQSMTGRLDWGRQADGESAQEGSGPQRLQASGGSLPVRQPRPATPSAPLSPSGSLWERNIEPAGSPADDPDSASRPIYVWSPPEGSTESSGESAELTPGFGDWRLRGRRQHPPGG